MNFKFQIAKFFASFFFVGFIKKAPGTFGSLASLIVIYPFFESLNFHQKQYIIYAVFFLGTIATHYYMKITHKSDPKEVVIDETLGVYLCLFVNYEFFPFLEVKTLFFVSFILFRFFDILKPFPISLIDRKMDNALGVMLDDAMAGIVGSAVFIIFMQIYDKFFTW